MKKILLLSILSCLCVLLTGCFLYPRLTTKPTVPTSVQKATVRKTTKPIVVVSHPGEPITVVTSAETTESTTEYSSTKKELTFFQKLGRWIGGLATVAIILLIVGLVLCPGTVIVFLARTIKKWRNAFKETVGALSKSKATNNARIKKSLEKEQTAKTKALVEKVKEKNKF